MRRLPLALLLALPAAAADAPPLPDQPTSVSTPGWSRQGKSLLLYGPDGALASEVGLSREEHSSYTREVLGGVAADARAAWTLERKLNYTPSRSKLLESRRLLRVYGSSGQSLWTDDAADLPEQGDPIAFSADSKVMLLARHVGEAWTVEARDWAGGVLFKAGPFQRLHSISLAPGGRFAAVRWNVADKSDTYTFLDVQAKARQDIETAELTLGLARIGDDGVARSGRREVLRFPLEPAAEAPK